MPVKPLNSFAKPVRKSTPPFLQQHAQQVAHLSADLRRNADELSIMQKELMELHRENARLLQQLSTQPNLMNEQ